MGEKYSLTKKKIIKNLYYSQALSCAELSLRIGKSLPITTKLLNELIDEEYVVETGYAPSTGGRKPVTYTLGSSVLYIISVAMDQFVTRVAVMNIKNEFAAPVKKFELPLFANREALTVLIKNIEEIIKDAGISKNKIVGVGIGMPGFVDVKKGINYSYLPLGEKNIAQHICDKIKIPVFIDNDSSVIALAELQFGAARSKKNVMVVNAGWGTGLGLILNGELFRGHNGFAGEFSHIPLFQNGKLCACGKSGCLETEASLLIVVEKAREGLQSGQVSKIKELSPNDAEEACLTIINAANDGDRFAIGLLSEAGYKIGRGVAVLIHLFNPEIVILSGRGSAAGKIWKAPLQQAINEYCIPRLAEHTSIEISTLGYDAELIGAAALVMENYEKETAVKNHSLMRQIEVV